MRNFTKAMLAGVLVAMASAPAAAYVYDYTPCTPGADRYLFGYKLAEHYDCGIFVPGSADFVKAGAKIAKISAAVPNAPEKITSYKMWISSKLTDPGKGVAFEGDIYNCDVEVVANEGSDYGIITCELPEAYVLPATGVYVGYSFEVPKVITNDTPTNYPIVVTNEDSEGSLYVRVADSYPKWDENVYSICLTATLEGDFLLDGVSVTTEPGYVKVGNESYVIANLTNTTVNEVSSINYSYTLGDKTKSDKVTVRLDAKPGSKAKIRVPVEAFDAVGQYTGTITIDKVNNNDNTCSTPEASMEYNVLERMPVHIPVVEEYTGTWCGWCTRGFAGLQALSDKVEDSISLAYHGGDIMEVKEVPSQGYSLGYPRAFIDRRINVDPYYGTSMNTPFGIVDNYNDAREVFAPADIAATAEWTDDENAITVNATANFVMIPSTNNYRIAYALVQDGMTGDDDNWTQQNYYSGYSGKGDPYLNEFFYASKSIKNFVFNDVCIFSSGKRGVSSSLPKTTELETYKDYTHSYTINLSKCVSKADGRSLVQNKDKMHVVVMVVDLDTSDGTIVNATKVKVPVPSSVENILNNVEEVSTVYYDLQGRVVEKPAPGIYVKSVRLANGSVKSEKVVVK